MLKRQINSQNRFQALLNVMNQFNSSWAGNIAVSTVFATLNNLFEGLLIAGTNQQTNNKGITQSKAQARAALIELALRHSAAAVAYAASINNTTLKINSRVMPSTLSRANDVALDDICQSLYNLIIPYAANLDAFGADTASLVSFQAAITFYQPISQQPKNARAAKKTATLNIKAQLNAINILVKEQLDALMLQFKTTNPDFYNQYMGLRHLVHGSNRLKTVIILIDITASNGLALANAAINLTSAKGFKRNKLSKADGTLLFTRLKPDSFTIVVSLPGYITQTQHITLNAPQKLRMHVVLVED